MNISAHFPPGICPNSCHRVWRWPATFAAPGAIWLVIGFLAANAAGAGPGRLVGWGNGGWGQLNFPSSLSNNVVAIAAGDYHSMALKSDGTVLAWGGAGSDYQEVKDVPPGLSNVVAISANSAVSLALCANGTVVAWGPNYDGRLNVPQGLSNVIAIAAGGYHALVLKNDGMVVAWGQSYGQCDVPEGLNGVVAVAAGGHHSLALKSDGTVVGWGYNGYGQTTPPADLTNAIAIDAGLDFSVALRRDGSVVQWGWNQEGVLTPPSALTGVKAVVAGGRHCAALKHDGTVVVWGQDVDSDLNPPAGLSNVVAVSAGHYHNLAIVALPLQTVSEAWVARYTNHAAGGAAGAVVKVDAAGNVYVGGRKDGGASGMDFLVLKYDRQGRQLWEASFGNMGIRGDWIYGDVFGDLAVDAEGNVLVAGSGRDQSDFATLKYGPNGNLLWVARYAYPGGDVMNSYGPVRLAVADGNVYVTGASVGSLETGTDIATVKYDRDGHELWTARFTGYDRWWDIPAAIKLDAAGNLLIAGHSYYRVGDEEASEIILLKYSPQGQLLWRGTYRAPEIVASTTASGLVLDAAGNALVVGTISADHGLNPDYITLKFNAHGQLLWTARYDGPAQSYDFGAGIALDRHNNAIVTGTSCATRELDDGDDPIEDFLTIKYDGDGRQLWEAREDAHSVNGYVMVALDAADNIYLTGIAGDDYLTLQYNPDGQRVWQQRFNDPQPGMPYHSASPRSLAVDDAGNVFVTGIADGNVATVKYAQSVTTAWVTNLPGARECILYVDHAGHAYLAGNSQVAKIAPDGQRLWTSPFTRPGGGNGGMGWPAALATDQAGNVHVTGYTTRADMDHDFTTIKLDAQGNLLWAAHFGLGQYSSDIAVAIGLDAAGNVYVGGTEDQNSGHASLVLLKYDSAGREVWAARYRGAYDAAYCQGLAVDPAGGVCVIGTVNSALTYYDWAVIKFDSAGNQVWSANFGGPEGDDQPQALTIDVSGNLIVTGVGRSGDASALTTIKYGPLGQLLWVARDFDRATCLRGSYAIASDRAGNILVAANGVGRDDGNEESRGFATIKYDPAGRQLWASRFFGTYHGGRGFAVDQAGNAYLTTALGDFADQAQPVTIKYDPNGNQVWMLPFPLNDRWGEISMLGLGLDDSVYVAGIVYEGGTNYDFVLAKYLQARQLTSNSFAPGSLDFTFDPTAGGRLVGLAGGSASVNCVVPQSDGRILIAGDFIGVNGVPRRSIARLMSDATLDPSFDPSLSADGPVNHFVLQADGKPLIIGQFQAVNGQPHRCIARLNTDGTLDASFNCNLGGATSTAMTYPADVALQSDGRIWVCGSFTHVNGLSCSNLARLHPDGSLDTSFCLATAIPGNNQWVDLVCVQPDDKVLLGGRWTNPDRSLVRLNADGTLDASFTNLYVTEFGLPGHIFAVDLQADGQIALVGSFYYVNGVPRHHVAQLNANGALNTDFAPQIASMDSIPRTVLVQPDGRLVIGGWFTMVNGAERRGLLRLNRDGTMDESFDPANAIGHSARPDVNSLALQPDGRLLVGAGASWRDNTNCVLRLDAAGQRELNFNADLQASPGSTTILTVQPDGKVLIAGEFTSINGLARPGFARLNFDGLLDPTFNPPINQEFRPSAAAVQSDGKILLGGTGACAPVPVDDDSGYLGCEGVIRLNPDGSRDASFVAPYVACHGNPPIETIAVLPDGKILIGGLLISVNGVPYDGIARLQADGRLDTSFQPVPIYVSDDPGYGVEYIHPLANGQILIAGGFQWDTGGFASVARLFADGTVDTNFVAQLPEARELTAFAVQPDGKIVVNAPYTAGTDWWRLVRLNTDGSLDASFNTPVRAEVRSLAVLPNGKLLASTNAMLAGALVCLNPDGSLDPSWQTDFGANAPYPAAHRIFQLPDGRVLISGAFVSVNGFGVPGLARLHGFESSRPLITGQPFSRTKFASQSATLQVQAEGPGPLSYQWMFNGAPIAGATGPELLLAGLQAAQAGGYTVVVASGSLSVTSTVANLTVLPVPTGPGSVDVSFDVTGGGERLGVEGKYGGVFALDVTPAGQLVIGGRFIGVNGTPRYRLARINLDGSLDRNFMSWGGLNGDVFSVVCQPDGKTLITGEFTEVNGQARERFARLNEDGTLDESFVPQLPRTIWGGPQPIVLQADGKILAGINWQDDNHVIHLRLLRLNADGSVDAAFQPELDVADTNYSQLNSLAVSADGKILVGYFNQATNTILRRLWPDGRRDESFNAAITRTDDGLTSVADMVIQADGKIIALGTFEARNSEGAVVGRNFVRLHPDGQLDETFHADASPYGDVRLRLQPDGRIVVGGSFYVDWAWHCLMRFNADGSVDPAFNVDEAPWRYNWLQDLHLLPDGRLVAAVHRRENDPSTDDRRFLEIFQPDGRLDDSLALEVNAAPQDIHVILPQPDGKVLLGGDFISINNTPRFGVARLNTDGSLDTTFEPPIVRAGVTAMALQSDGAILLATGYIAPGNGINDPLVRLTPGGSLDTSFVAGISNGSVHAIVPLANGTILVGGEFFAGDQSCLARLHPDGTRDPAFNAGGTGPLGVDLNVAAMAVQPDNKILIGGEFYSYNDVPMVGLARLNPDGSLDTSFQPPLFAYTAFICLQPDGRILISGYFSEYENGPPLPSLLRLLPDGSLDPQFQSAVTVGGCLALQPDGKILVAGNFYEGPESLRQRGLIRLHPDGSLDTAFNVRGAAAPLVLLPNGQILVGIQNNFINGIPLSGVARLNNDLVIPVPFVERDLTSRFYVPGGSTYEVRLYAHPQTGVAVYAVEDQPPTGWAVSIISHGGVFDPATGKVKFGPFFDNTWRTLSYVVTPNAGSTNAQCFNGVAAADGVFTPISGLACMFPLERHPADRNLDWQLGIAEVTAYGAAWRRGDTWPAPPNPIPIDYVTRMAALWRDGECYTTAANATNAPLWWVSCSAAQRASLAEAGMPVADASVARRALPAVFIPGQPLTVILSVAPASRARAYAVEDQFPPGWTVSQISDSGELDSANHKLKWGPYFDASPRVFAYRLTPPVNSAGPVTFAGIFSTDGVNAPITGASQLRTGSRLAVNMAPGGDRVILNLAGELGRKYLIEISSDLVAWRPLITITNTAGSLEFSDSERPACRFYRAKLVESPE